MRLLVGSIKSIKYLEYLERRTERSRSVLRVLSCDLRVKRSAIPAHRSSSVGGAKLRTKREAFVDRADVNLKLIRPFLWIHACMKYSKNYDLSFDNYKMYTKWKNLKKTDP